MKISIVTTNFNTAKYLEQTIVSILEQKGDFDLEYIITDGGSKDNSMEIIKRYDKELKEGKWGKRILFKYLSEKDKGQSDGINKGLRMATGDIIAFLNADDLYTEGALEKVKRYFQENPDYMWVTGYCRIVDKDGEEIRKFITKYKDYKLRRYSYEKLLIEDFISQPSTFWRRELLHEIGYLDEDLHYAMDYEYWCRIGQKYPLGLIKDSLAEFRFTNDTKTGSSTEKTLEESMYIAKKYANKDSVILKQKFNNTKRLVMYKMLKLLGK